MCWQPCASRFHELGGGKGEALAAGCSAEKIGVCGKHSAPLGFHSAACKQAVPNKQGSLKLRPQRGHGHASEQSSLEEC